jgi:hypothetical protein
MNKIRCLPKSILVCMISFLAIVATAEHGTADIQAPAGYGVYQSIPISLKPSGNGAFLQILQDSRVTPPLRKALWGHGSLQPDMALSVEQLKFLQPLPLRSAHLRMIDANGRAISDETLDVSLAQIRVVFLYGNAKPAYQVELDDTTGMGSYRGIRSEFLEIRSGTLQQITAVEQPHGDVIYDALVAPLILEQAVKSHWRIVSDHGGVKTIESVSCRPVSTDSDAPEFVVTYSTYRFNGSGWYRLKRETAGFWEYDGPESWPSRDKFP